MPTCDLLNMSHQLPACGEGRSTYQERPLLCYVEKAKVFFGKREFGCTDVRHTASLAIRATPVYIAKLPQQHLVWFWLRSSTVFPGNSQTWFGGSCGRRTTFQWAVSMRPSGSEHENRVIMGVQGVLYQLMAVMEGTQDQRLPRYISLTSADMATGSLTSWFRLSSARGFQTAGGMWSTSNCKEENPVMNVIFAFQAHGFMPSAVCLVGLQLRARTWLLWLIGCIDTVQEHPKEQQRSDSKPGNNFPLLLSQPLWMDILHTWATL